MPRPRDIDPADPALARAARAARAALASNLRRLRAASGLSQAAVAERAGVSSVYVGLLESLRPQNPTLTALACLAHALDVTVDQLVVPAAAPKRRRVGRPKAAVGTAPGTSKRAPPPRSRRR